MTKNKSVVQSGMITSKIISLVAIIGYLIAGEPITPEIPTNKRTFLWLSTEYSRLCTGFVPYGIVFPEKREFDWPVEITFAFTCVAIMSIFSWLPTVGGIVCGIITASKICIKWEDIAKFNLKAFSPKFLALSIILGTCALLPSLSAIVSILGFLINSGLCFLPIDPENFSFIRRFVSNFDQVVNQDKIWGCLEKNAKFVGALLLNYLVQMLLKSLLSPVLLFIATTLMVVGTNFILSRFLTEPTT